MLSEQGADLVMSEIEYLTNVIHDPRYHGQGAIDAAIAKAMLNHLYNLHRLRDRHIYKELDTHLFYYGMCDQHNRFKEMGHA